MCCDKSSSLILLYLVFLLVCLRAQCDDSDVTVNFLKAPPAFSARNSAAFVFDVLESRNGNTSKNHSIICKLDGGVSSDCKAGRISYVDLHDGYHLFEVCISGSRGGRCASYNWTIDTIPPTAYITAAASFTNALNVSVNISFSEPCTGEGAFGCSSVNSCNLLVYGAGQVIPRTLKILQPDIKYSLLVQLSSSVQYGRVILVMDKSFCTDSAGNKFTRTTNSSLFIHFDRRNVFVNLRTHIPEKPLQIDSEIRTVEATNNYKNLKLYLYFSEPVINSSSEILNSLHTSQGLLLPTHGKKLGNHRFGFLVKNLSSTAVVTLTLDSSSIISRQGTTVSPSAPVTFLYDTVRPAVRLSTTSNMRTREASVPMLIKFMKPVFDFNSSVISISGGNLQSFQQISRRLYTIDIHAYDDMISVSVPENITEDVAGNKNLASNVLKVRHYSVPVISSVLSIFATGAFVVTSFVGGLLTVSTASLQSVGAISRPSSTLTCDPTRNIFRIASHIQIFALSRWLAVTLPVEYYEFVRGLEWSIPYFSLPWETGHIQSITVGSNPPAISHSYASKNHVSETFKSTELGDRKLDMAASVFGLPLTPMEYRSFFESQSFKPEAEYIMNLKSSNGWTPFCRNMFWLAVVGGSLMLLHAFFIFVLKYMRKNSENSKDFRALTFPRFEIFLIILALPCICQASAALIKGGATSGIIVGALLFGLVCFLLLALLLFLSIGITLGKLLQYKEVQKEGQKFHWYLVIVRATLGPGKRGQWTWKNQPNCCHLTMLGPLFEDLRGPPKYMLSQITGGNPSKHGDRIIASDDETEDAEAPFIQKLFGILRIYYTLLELVRRVALGIVAGAYSDSWSFRTPTLSLLCMTSFQLFFLVLKKPFIKKRVQLVEIISVATEVGIFTTCLILLEREFSAWVEKGIGKFMLLLFLIGFSTQMFNEWIALYTQTIRLGPSFLSGLKMASIGFILIFFPRKLLKNIFKEFPLNRTGSGETGDASSSGGQRRTSGRSSSDTSDKSWMKRLRELAKASFSRDDTGAMKDPSSSQIRSGFGSGKRSGSSSVTSSADFKSKSKKLYNDLEEIFSSK